MTVRRYGASRYRRCEGITKSGSRCKNKSKELTNLSWFCKTHVGQADCPPEGVCPMHGVVH